MCKKKNILKILKIYIVINCVYLFQFVIFYMAPSLFRYLEFNRGPYISSCQISLVLYIYYLIFAGHIILDICLLIYSIHNRIKHNVRKGFVFTVIITLLSIMLNIFAHSYAYMGSGQ